jgi:PAS domain S-box-containing protein
MRLSRHAWWLYLTLTVPISVAYLAGPLNAGPVFNVVGFSSVIAILVGVGIHRPAARWAWCLIALGQALFAAGDVLAYNYKALFGGPLPFPSVADPLYLAVYPVTVAGLLLLIRARTRGRDWASLLDATIVTIGLALLSWVFLISPYAHSSLHLGVKLVSIAYPLGDILVLGVAVRMAVGAGRRSTAYYMMISAIAALLVTDSVYGWIVLHGTYHPGDPLDGGWLAFYILWGAAALHPSMTTVSQPATPRATLTPLRIASIAAAALVAPVIEVVKAASSANSDGVVIGCGAVVLFSLVVTRMIMLARESAALTTRVLRTESEARLGALVQHSTDVILVVTRDTKVEYVSPSIAAIFGYQPATFVGERLFDYVPGEDRARLEPALAALIARNSEASQAFECRVRHRDGRLLHAECLIANLLSNQAVRGIVVNLRDATERNRAATEVAVARDQAVEASNMKSAFLANVSHEIRTPLNGVIGMSELMLDTKLTDEQRSYAEQVARSGEQTLSIVNDILDISKIETGHLELDVADFDLHTMLNEACVAARPPAQAKGPRLDLEIATSVPHLVRGDARRLQQIVANLLTNAVKFTAIGTITVRVSATPAATRGNLIRVEVADTGIGIDPASLQRMFEPFTQADNSTTRLYGGTGLGLSIVRELVELMGGTVSAESEPGRGSRFWFEIELSLPRDMRHRLPADVAAPLSWSSPPLVLIAEDSPVNRIVASRGLERCGCRSHAVGDGQEALEALQAQHYDAVLMDCQMPILDGYKATTALRRRESGPEHVPVIAMTANAMDGDRQRCLDAGMDDYITKPMRHADLAEMLRRWIPSSGDDGERVPLEHAPAGRDDPQTGCQFDE